MSETKQQQKNDEDKACNNDDFVLVYEAKTGFVILARAERWLGIPGI